MNKFLILIAILAPTLALLYFGLGRDPRSLPSALVSRPAPGFELNTVDGKKISLAEAKGKPVVLNFWSTWCGPCAAEYQLLREAGDIYTPQGVLFYSILYEDTVENVRKFLARYGEAGPILMDPGLRTAIDYGVSGVPETFFIDASGIILHKHAGVLTPDVVEENITNLLDGTRVSGGRNP